MSEAGMRPSLSSEKRETLLAIRLGAVVRSPGNEELLSEKLVEPIRQGTDVVLKLTEAGRERLASECSRIQSETHKWVRKLLLRGVR